MILPESYSSLGNAGATNVRWVHAVVGDTDKRTGGCALFVESLGAFLESLHESRCPPPGPHCLLRPHPNSSAPASCSSISSALSISLQRLQALNSFIDILEQVCVVFSDCRCLSPSLCSCLRLRPISSACLGLFVSRSAGLLSAVHVVLSSASQCSKHHRLKTRRFPYPTILRSSRR